MSLLHETMRRTYAAQRAVSQGAHITLTAVSGGYTARFECAARAASILGTRNLNGDLLLIPTDELHRSITKLAESYSVALVDTVTDDQGATRFALIWKIAPTKAVLPAMLDNFEVRPGTPEVQVFEKCVVHSNQGAAVNLDEY